jgi:hypothetical protein
VFRNEDGKAEFAAQLAEQTPTIHKEAERTPSVLKEAEQNPTIHKEAEQTLELTEGGRAMQSP